MIATFTVDIAGQQIIPTTIYFILLYSLSGNITAFIVLVLGTTLLVLY